MYFCRKIFITHAVDSNYNPGKIIKIPNIQSI